MFSEEEEYDYLFKIVIIGDSGVGKSNLLLRYSSNEFRKNSKSTIGVEFATKTIKIDGTQIKAQLWDTSGQERYKAITSAFYRGAVGAILVYDVTRKSSFEHIGQWVKELREHTDLEDPIPLVLIGNKLDLVAGGAGKSSNSINCEIETTATASHSTKPDCNRGDSCVSSRETTVEEARTYAESQGMLFFETSAYESTNVTLAFETILQHIYKELSHNNLLLKRISESNAVNGVIVGKRTSSRFGSTKNLITLSQPQHPSALYKRNHHLVDTEEQQTGSKGCC